MTLPKNDAARQIFAIVSKAPMSDRVRQRFKAMADAGDHLGMLRYLEACCRDQPEVGRSVMASGLVSFESVLPEVRRICQP